MQEAEKEERLRLMSETADLFVPGEDAQIKKGVSE